jgi:hypothetical protein
MLDAATFDAAREGLARLRDDLPALRWIRDWISGRGVPLSEAAEVAVSDVDIVELKRLLSLGCPLRTAIRIAS